MDDNDRRAIEGLFERIGEVERKAPPRDREAEAFIARQIAAAPAAPYFMAQTIVVQEAALTAAQARIEELEGLSERRATGGGLFGGIFGDNPPPPRARAAAPRSEGGPWARQAGGGGFLAGAAQTAMGVAGGVLLGNAIAGMFGGGAAEASEPPEDPETAEPPAVEDDFGDMDF